MGCVSSKQTVGTASHYDHSKNHGDSSRGGGPTPPAVMVPDPYLGWKRIISEDEVQFSKKEASSSRNGNEKWVVNLHNERNGSRCVVSILVMALNIAVRASRLAQKFGLAFSTIEANSKTIYRALRIPDHRWKLIERKYTPPRKAAKTKSKFSDNCEDSVFAKMQQGSDGCLVFVDVAEIGMNISEQLYRLEKGQRDRDESPINLFGWSVTETESGFGVMILSPVSEPFWFVPEELIMNTSSWVQTTYLTQPMLAVNGC